MISLKKLEVACANYKLTDLLKELSDEEIQDLLSEILYDDLVDIRLKVYETLCIEVECRKSDKLQSMRTK